MKIAIASGKGGTGKTTISTNLAMYLSETMNVKLVDLDVEEPNSGLFLNLPQIDEEIQNSMIPKWEKENCTLCGLCQKVCNFNAVMMLGEQIVVFPELCKSCYACSELCPENSLPMEKQRIGNIKHYRSDNLFFIEGKLDLGQESATPMVEKTIKYTEQYEDENITLYDSPPGASCPVIEAAKNVDLVFLVTEPTPFGLHDLKIAVDTMRELGKELAVIINRYGIGDDEVIRYCEEERIEIIAKVPNSRKIAELYSSGTIVYDKIPEMKVELDKIKKYISDKKIGGRQ